MTKEDPSIKVKVAEVVGAVMVTLLIEVAVATPKEGVVNVGLVNVLLVRVWVAASKTTVSVVDTGRIRVVAPEVVNLRVLPAVLRGMTALAPKSGKV